jgi:hypothetical protein
MFSIKRFANPAVVGIILGACLCCNAGAIAANAAANTSVIDIDAAVRPPNLPIAPRSPPHVGVNPLQDLPLGSGGSNYLWYTQTAAPDCNRDPYGVVANYADPAVRATVQKQLAAMRIAGMARINLGINFYHGPTLGGTLIDSSNPVIVAQTVQNVTNLMADVKAAGFSQVLFRFFPQGAISPPDPNYNYALVSEHWNLIQAVRPALVNSGVPYLIDLSVEAAPRDSQLPLVSNPWKYPAKPNWSMGVRALWQNYFKAYGSADTIGFSFITDSDADDMRSRVRHMRYVFEGNYPSVFALDIYGPSFNGDPTPNETVKFTQFDSAMKNEDSSNAMGWYKAGFIVAETFYNDPLAAENIRAAMSSTGRRVYFLAQWPWDRGANADNSANCVGINVPPPFSWDVYRLYGF